MNKESRRERRENKEERKKEEKEREKERGRKREKQIVSEKNRDEEQWDRDRVRPEEVCKQVANGARRKLSWLLWQFRVLYLRVRTHPNA